MNSTPQELIFFLLFGAVLLLQLLYKHWRGKAEGMQAPGAPQEPDQATAAPPMPARPFAPASTNGPQPTATPAPAVRLSPLVRRRQRRFSRADLMPDRRAVQDAIVIAAILSPCHAQRPHGTE